MMKFISVLLFLCVALQSPAATKYLDSSVSSSGVGTSWATAFKTLADVTASAGDTVYISGGSTGNSLHYTVPGVGYWNAPSGSGNGASRITYKIGQDSSHNGTAIFDPGLYELLSGCSYINFSGDAGDGAMHFKLGSSFSTHAVINNINHFTFEYVDGSSGVALLCSPAGNWNDVDINHCYMNMVDLAGDHLLGISFSGTVSTDNKIHHNTFLFPHVGPGTGADCIQGSGSGYSIYNNTIRGYTAAYTAAQHQDGFQATGGSNIDIYNNDFVDCGNYAIYLDAYFAGFTDVRCWNNWIRFEDSALVAGTPGGIIAGVDGGWNGQNPGATCTFLRIYFLNNVIADYQGNGGIALSNVRPDINPNYAFTNCYIENNLLVNNASGIRNENNTTSTIDHNVEITAANAVSYLLTYSTYGTSNNFGLTSSATPVIHQGIDRQALFTFTDRSGNAYASPPSVGATEYAAGGDTTPPVVTISAPTASTTYSTSTTPLTSLAGTASDDVALSSVTWSNSAGGSGAATGTTSWSVASITLASGSNVITVTATDTSANTSTDTLTITYTPPAAATPTNYRKARTLAGGGL